jgi:hypothetical protein
MVVSMVPRCADSKLDYAEQGMGERKVNYYFTISRFFQRRFLPLHFLHFNAVPALRAPQSLQIFMYKRCFWAIVFLTGSNIGIFCVPSV